MQLSLTEGPPGALRAECIHSFDTFISLANNDKCQESPVKSMVKEVIPLLSSAPPEASSLLNAQHFLYLYIWETKMALIH